MNDTPHGADLEPVVSEQAEPAEIEDQDFDGFDNLSDAADALEDDLPDDEEPTEDTPEGEEPEEATEGEESDPGDAIVELPDGNTLTVSEIADLQANGLRTADYTHKTTELARERDAVKAEKATYTERLQYAENTLQNIAGFMQSLIPAEPGIDLAQSNPAEYTQQKALREAAIAEMRKLSAMNGDIQGHKSETGDADKKAFRDSEAAALVKAMPHLSDPVKRDAFNKAVEKTAVEFGFSPDEIATTADHRILRLVHYARLGKRSETNRNNAKRRVQTPAQGKAKAAQIPAAQRSNRDAMQRLSKSGSFADAMKVDLD